MAPYKRPAMDEGSLNPESLVKRQKSDVNMGNTMSIAIVSGHPQNSALIQATARPSSLSAPVMELSGHESEIYACRFDPKGQFIASGSQDKDIRLWRAHGQCENYGKLVGHKGAVLDLQWSRDSSAIYSASADKFIFSWDTETGQRVRRHAGHEAVVNALDVSRRGDELLYSGSDDGSIAVRRIYRRSQRNQADQVQVWDPRTKDAVLYIESDYPVTAVAAAEAGHEIYTGGIDPDIKVWDMRKREVSHSLISHADIITSLQVSPDAQLLLSNSMDNTVRTWNIRPFAPGQRLVHTFDGATRGLDMTLVRASWSPDSKKIAAGSGDGSVVMWDASNNGKLLSKMPGHKGTVNDVRFHPSEPISKFPHPLFWSPVSRNEGLQGVGRNVLLSSTVDVRNAGDPYRHGSSERYQRAALPSGVMMFPQWVHANDAICNSCFRVL